MLKADRHGKVQLKATQFFTRNSPTTGAILHGDDRKEADAAAQYPYVSPEDAEYLISEGLAKEYSGDVPLNDDEARAMTVDERSGEYVEHHNDAENSVEQTTGLSTRQTTAFERPIEQLAGSGGANRAVLEGDDGGTAPASEEDAPATGRRSGGSRSRSSGSEDK